MQLFCGLPSIRQWLPRRFRRGSTGTVSGRVSQAQTLLQEDNDDEHDARYSEYLVRGLGKHTKPPLTGSTARSPYLTDIYLKNLAGVGVDEAVPASFTTFPVRVHVDEGFIVEGYDAARQMFRAAGVPDFDKRSHSAGPHGNFFALAWPAGDRERVRLMAEIVESLWIYDDVIEAVPHEEAAKEHERVKQTFDGVVDKKSLLASIFKDYGKRLTQLDPIGGPGVIAGLKTYLTEYDRSNECYETIAEYVAFRGLNVGFGIMEVSMQWTCAVPLTPSDTALLPSYKAYYAAAAAHMALTNDFFSWETERDEPTDRPRNAVPIIMRQYAIDETAAKVFLKGTIVEAEQETRRLGLEVLKEAAREGRTELRERVERYVEMMELMLAGNLFWSADCPRYHPWLYEEEKEEEE